MSKKPSQTVQEITSVFTQIFMKYDVLQKRALDLGDGTNLPAAYIHMIEAIGENRGNSVTVLGSHFMVTKGAISQVTSKLQKEGYLLKTKQPGNDKNIIFELTKKGWNAFRHHQRYNESVMGELRNLTKKYTTAELRSFANILADLDAYFGKHFISENKPGSQTANHSHKKNRHET